MRFLQPETQQEALDLLAADPDGAKVIAGGTALVLMLRQKLLMLDTLVSVEKIPGLSGIEAGADGVRIGAMTRLVEVAGSAVVRDRYPALATSCGVVGNVRVRSQATLGGNVAEADYASDPPTVLMALDAWVTVAGVSGMRETPLSDFILGFYTTTLEAGEIVQSIHVPPLPENTRMTYLKYKSRSSEDRPCAGVAAVASFDGDRCVDLRVAVGAACEVPKRLPELEQMARSNQMEDGLIREIAEGYAEQIDTLEDLRGSAWYRKQMIRVHVRRALEEVRDGHR